MIHDFWDCPRLGIADVSGIPHVFRCRFSTETDDWADDFFLMEIDKRLLLLAVEKHEIFLRWAKAFNRGETTVDTHLALPIDQDRHQELKSLIGNGLDVPESSKSRKAVFRNVDLYSGAAEVMWLDGSQQD